MDLVCPMCGHAEYFARYDVEGFIIQCVDCAYEEVLGS